MNASHKTSKLVRQISIESSFMKNFSHGNNHTRRRRLRKENTVKTRTSLQKKLARSGSARTVEETMPLCIFNEHVNFSKTIQTRVLEIIVSKFRKLGSLGENRNGRRGQVEGEDFGRLRI